MNDNMFESVKITLSPFPRELKLDWDYVEQVNEYVINVDGGDLRVVPLDGQWFVLSRKVQSGSWMKRGSKGFPGNYAAQLYAERWAKKKGWVR